MRVFLLHGMARTGASMILLSHRLKKVGHRPKAFGYQVALRDFDTIVDRFVSLVEKVLAEDRSAGSDPSPYAVVGHSLGNLITRAASPRLPEGFARFVMLAPPNRSPQVVRLLEGNPLFRWFTRDAGNKLAQPEFFESLPLPEVPTLILAGNKGPRHPSLPLGDTANDLILRLRETELEGIPRLVIPATHSFLMNRRDVFEAVRDFLEDPGSFDRLRAS